MLTIIHLEATWSRATFEYKDFLRDLVDDKKVFITREHLREVVIEEGLADERHLFVAAPDVHRLAGIRIQEVKVGQGVPQEAQDWIKALIRT
jgi:hypothetical protein